MTDRENLIELLNVDIYPHEAKSPAEVVADYLLDNGVTFAKDTNVPSWIPVSERLPEERESFFAKCYGTEKWVSAMFRAISSDVLVCAIGKDGKKMVKVMHTTDGKWRYPYSDVEVTHWMPLPEPPEVE